MSTKAAGQ